MGGGGTPEGVAVVGTVAGMGAGAVAAGAEASRPGDRGAGHEERGRQEGGGRARPRRTPFATRTSSLTTTSTLPSSATNGASFPAVTVTVTVLNRNRPSESFIDAARRAPNQKS